jgi:hypothetical protein
MSVVGMGSMAYLATSRGASSSIYFPVGCCLLILSSALQICMMQLRPQLSAAFRHQLVWFNRISRFQLLLGPLINHNFEVVHKLIPTHHLQHLEYVLLASLGVIPMAQFYGNLCFVVPVRTLLFMQLPAVTASIALSAPSHASLIQIPGMLQLAESACAHVRGVFELALHVLVDQGTMPGVPAAGFDAGGIPSRCHGRASVMVMALYANLSLVYFLPIFISFTGELRHKRLFWEARSATVKVQASPLLPFPSHHLAAHCCVLLCTQILLWFVAELLTAVLV